MQTRAQSHLSFFDIAGANTAGAGREHRARGARQIPRCARAAVCRRAQRICPLLAPPLPRALRGDSLPGTLEIVCLNALTGRLEKPLASACKGNWCCCLPAAMHSNSSVFGLSWPNTPASHLCAAETSGAFRGQLVLPLAVCDEARQIGCRYPVPDPAAQRIDSRRPEGTQPPA